MEEKDVLKQVIDNLLDTPDVLTLPVKPRNRWHQLLIKYKLQPKTRKYKLRRLLVGNAYRVSKAVLDIPSDIVNLKDTDGIKGMHTLVLNHLDQIVYIVAVALQNNRQEPSKAFLNRIRWEFNQPELLAVLRFVIQRLDLTNFTESIVLVRGADIISQTSPEVNAEIIARSDLSEAL